MHQGDSLARLREHFPTLVAVVGESRLGEDLALWAHALKTDEWFTEKPSPGYSRGFWNEVVAFSMPEAYADAPSWVSLTLVERGLAAAAAIGKAGKYRRRLTKEDKQYAAIVAELGIIGALARLGDYDLEQPGSDPKRDYDLLVRLGGMLELHVEVKHRREAPLGVSPQHLVPGLIGLIGSEALRHGTPQVDVTSNRISDDDLVEVADVVEKLLRVHGGDHPGQSWPLAERHLLQRDFPPELLGATQDALEEGRSVRLFHVDGFHVIHCSGGKTQYDYPYAVPQHRLVQRVDFAPPDATVTIFGVPESRALFSRSAIQSFGSRVPSYDDSTPESARYRDRMRGVPQQLPERPVNVLAFGLLHRSNLYELKLALYGEPFRDDDGRRCLRGGVFDEPGWERIAGALAFHVEESSTPGAVRLAPTWLENRRVVKGFEIAPPVLREILNAAAQ